jgi:hypothetical protein
MTAVAVSWSPTAFGFTSQSSALPPSTKASKQLSDLVTYNILEHAPEQPDNGLHKLDALLPGRKQLASRSLWKNRQLSQRARPQL